MTSYCDRIILTTHPKGEKREWKWDLPEENKNG